MLALDLAAEHDCPTRTRSHTNKAMTSLYLSPDSVASTNIAWEVHMLLSVCGNTLTAKSERGSVMMFVMPKIIVTMLRP